jgi:hypothetical protein
LLGSERIKLSKRRKIQVFFGTFNFKEWLVHVKSPLPLHNLGKEDEKMPHFNDNSINFLLPKEQGGIRRPTGESLSFL